MPGSIPFLLLLLVLLLSYSRLAFSNGILVGYDLLTYFYPLQSFAAFSLHEGRLPLWNPYLFGGVPFLANIQTAVLYPLNFPIHLWAPPQATEIIVLLHLWLAGSFMYLFARQGLRLHPLSALVAALAYMLSGFLSAQVGHVNQLSAAAWLPLLLLCYETARQRSQLGGGRRRRSRAGLAASGRPLAGIVSVAGAAGLLRRLFGARCGCRGVAALRMPNVSVSLSLACFERGAGGTQPPRRQDTKR